MDVTVDVDIAMPHHAAAFQGSAFNGPADNTLAKSLLRVA
jgi:hypothetical protein